jgi:hypothetical protein
MNRKIEATTPTIATNSGKNSNISTLLLYGLLPYGRSEASQLPTSNYQLPKHRFRIVRVSATAVWLRRRDCECRDTRQRVKRPRARSDRRRHRFATVVQIGWLSTRLHAGDRITQPPPRPAESTPSGRLSAATNRSDVAATPPTRDHSEEDVAAIAYCCVQRRPRRFLRGARLRLSRRRNQAR